MKINNISGMQSFGIKMPENFAQCISENCAGISLEKAEKLVEKLKVLGNDSFILRKISTECKRPTLFSKKLGSIRIEYDRQTSNGDVIKSLYGDTTYKETPYSAKEIFQTIETIVKRIKE